MSDHNLSTTSQLIWMEKLAELKKALQRHDVGLLDEGDGEDKGDKEGIIELLRGFLKISPDTQTSLNWWLSGRNAAIQYHQDQIDKCENLMSLTILIPPPLTQLEQSYHRESVEMLMKLDPPEILKSLKKIE